MTVTDNSRNGTFVSSQHSSLHVRCCILPLLISMHGQINGGKIPTGTSHILRDGNEIAFGSHKLLDSEVEAYDYRTLHTAFNT